MNERESEWIIISLAGYGKGEISKARLVRKKKLCRLTASRRGVQAAQTQLSAMKRKLRHIEI